jgi:hypothetical protein
LTCMGGTMHPDQDVLQAGNRKPCVPLSKVLPVL